MKTQISGDIRKQEGEIEAIFRNLVRFTPGSCSHDSHDGANESHEQETTVWILLALLGLLSIAALYILWLRTGGLYAVADSREMFKADSRSDRTRSSALDTPAFRSIAVMKETGPEHFDWLVHHE